MKCQFCGSDLWLTAYAVGDRDFCSPSHRRKYHERLRHVMEQVSDPPLHLPQAGFQLTQAASPIGPEPTATPACIIWLCPERSYPVVHPALPLGIDSREDAGELPPDVPLEVAVILDPEVVVSPKSPAPVLPFALPAQPAPSPVPDLDADTELKKRLGRICADLRSGRSRPGIRPLTQSAVG